MTFVSGRPSSGQPTPLAGWQLPDPHALAGARPRGTGPGAGSGSTWPARTADHRGVTEPIVIRGRTIPADELSWRFSRSSGPGGQSVNTSDSRVELSYDLAASSTPGPALKERALQALAGRLVDGVITIAASEHRSQWRNREAAVSRLIALLTAATAPPPAARRPTTPTRGSKERRLASKQRRSQIKRLRRSTDE
jgi:ribosome-associated protein